VACSDRRTDPESYAAISVASHPVVELLPSAAGDTGEPSCIGKWSVAQDG